MGTAKNSVASVIGALVLIAVVVAGVGVVSKPRATPEAQPTRESGHVGPTTAAQREFVKPRASAIVASIQDFQNGMPVFERDGLARQREPNAIEYHWTSKVDASWIRFYDYGSDGVLDRVSAVFEVDTKKQNAALMAVATSYRLVQIASGLTALDAGGFSEWVSGNLKLEVAVTKQFGNTKVQIQATRVGEHPGMRLVIE